ncbi:MAG: M1 family aminopeptidase, partial [Planctomycetia bacterium]
GRTVQMMDFFSDRFGVEYPWPKYAQVVVEQFMWGGMENTSATTLVHSTMHDERAMLDDSPDWLIAHELAHQWWGDLLTCKDWSHLWLNEGFATYCEWLWMQHAEGDDAVQERMLRDGEAARSDGPKKRPVVDRYYTSPGSMFDARSYPKGAWVVHMLRQRVGDVAFFAGLKQYLTEYRHRTVETDDLRLVFERTTGRSLERFFHDWTERPGHPVVEVNQSYDADAKAVLITVKQTQTGDAFHFPLKVEVRVPGAEPIASEIEVVAKEAFLRVPTTAEPMLVRVDPDLTVLCEMKETKPAGWWKAQMEAPTLAERVRAMKHFQEEKTPAGRDALGASLKGDTFHGGRAAAARALGEFGGDAARDLLVGGLADEHPKVRRAVAQALGKFVGDATAVGALEKKVKEGDASYFVEAEMLESLASVQKTLTLEPLMAALERSSHQEVIRQAALSGMAFVSDEKALDVLEEWSEVGKPRECRAAALRAIATYLVRQPTADARKRRSMRKIADAVVAGETFRVRMAALDALRNLGHDARPVLADVEAVAGNDLDDRVREHAGNVRRGIVDGLPPNEELGRLRGEVDDLRKSNQEMKDRLQKLEKR